MEGCRKLSVNVPSVALHASSCRSFACASGGSLVLPSTVNVTGSSPYGHVRSRQPDLRDERTVGKKGARA